MTQKEAETLIEALKELEKKYIEIPAPSNSKEYIAYEIADLNSKFIILIRRLRMNPEKCTFQAMTKDTKKVLLRLDIVPDTHAHKNPDGEIIYGPHLHVFKENHAVAYAIKFDVDDPDLTQLCIDFLCRFNVIAGSFSVAYRMFN